MKIQVMDRAKKKKLIRELEDFGLKKIPETLVKSGTERIRAFSGELETEQIMEIWRLLPIEGIGLYVAKDMVNKNGVHEVRMSLDSMHLWKEQLTEKNFILTEEQEEIWFKGDEVELNEKQRQEHKDGFVLVKSFNEKDFVGMGKIGKEGTILYGYLPKERRRKSQVM
jgi:NOL1/NOP2/fmu family ribosome biogenesis protein